MRVSHTRHQTATMTTNTNTGRPSSSGKTSATINTIRERNGHVDVWDLYNEKRQLGQGASGTVRLVQRKRGTEGVRLR